MTVRSTLIRALPTPAAKRRAAYWLFGLALLMLVLSPVADDPAVDGVYEYRAISVDPDNPVEAAGLASLPSVGYTTDTDALWILRRADGGGISEGPLESPEGRAARFMDRYDYILVVDPDRPRPTFYEVVVTWDDGRYRLDSGRLTVRQLLKRVARDIGEVDEGVARVVSRGELATTDPLAPAVVGTDDGFVLVRQTGDVRTGIIEMVAGVVSGGFGFVGVCLYSWGSRQHR